MRRNDSITNRVLRYMMLIILFSNVVLFGADCYITQRNMTNQSMTMSRNLMESNLVMVEQYFNDIDNLASSVIYNSNIIRFMKSGQDKASDLEFLKGVESLYYNARPDLSLGFYKEGKYHSMYSIMQENPESHIDDYRETSWYQKLLGTDEREIMEVNDRDFVHSIVYRIEDVYGTGTVGYLKIDMDLNSLKERFLHTYIQIAGTTITDREGEILFWDKQVVQVPEELYQSQKSGIYETEDYLMAFGISESTGWHLCMAMSRREIFKNQTDMVKILIFILAVTVGCTLLVSRKCFGIITVNFKRLLHGMEEVKAGKLETQVEVDTQDEISFLITEFNEMMKKVDELVHLVQSKQLLLKEAEIKALQQQINPHFMHNIMETIIGLASEGMDSEVITVSKCMSAMLRYNTQMENTTQLEEEIRQIKNYVQVLKIQYEDRFDVFYDIDISCLAYRIVKFTLQPLVENAISHGLSETYSGGMLRIRIKEEGETISIMIFDNGTGIQEDYLRELNERLRETSEYPLQYIEKYKSLGLLNVHLRLKLYYGEAYSMEIFSQEKKGTCISIKLPRRQEDFLENGAELP